jgi:ABC-2 type transport system ATP-binding protein
MIRVEALSKTFKRARVLDSVGLRIGAGERVALVGANGAGKTTLIRCLLGQYGCEGSVLIDGKSPRLRRTEVLRRVGFVPQLPPPLGMSVAQLLRFAADLCRSDPARMEEVAHRLGLALRGVRHRPFAKLSGGQKQKLLIAVALGRDSRLLLLDEPAANLDPEGRRILFELLAERAGRVTMLISSHRLDEVASLVDRVVELDRGRVVLDDRVADSGSLGSLLRCHIELRRREDAVARTLGSWGFRERDGGRIWEGSVPGPDRLRFFGMLSRYSGLLSGIRVEELERPEG